MTPTPAQGGTNSEKSCLYDDSKILIILDDFSLMTLWITADDSALPRMTPDDTG